MNKQPVFCPVCGHAPLLSITEKFVRCGNNDCPLGNSEFFITVESWNKKAPIVKEKLFELMDVLYIRN